jgi:hypothetical protein
MRQAVIRKRFPIDPRSPMHSLKLAVSSPRSILAK